MRVRLLHENVQITNFVQTYSSEEKTDRSFSIGAEAWAFLISPFDLYVQHKGESSVTNSACDLPTAFV
jgi:hypothetical protein